MNLDGFLAKRTTPIVMYMMAILCNLVLKEVNIETSWVDIIVSISLAALIYGLAIFLSNRMRELAGLEEKRTDSNLRLVFWIVACLAFAIVAIGEFNLWLTLVTLVLVYVLLDLLIFKVFKVQ